MQYVIFFLSFLFIAPPFAWLFVVKRRHARRITNQTAKPSVSNNSKEQEAFHQAEFSALRTEVDELIKAGSSNFQYAVLASGAIFAWIAAKHEQSLLLSPYTIWLPPMISSLFFTLSIATYMKLREVMSYLRLLEDIFGNKQLGWQKWLENERFPVVLGPIYFYGWILLIGGEWAMAVYCTFSS